MTYKENIRAILECHFTGFKEEIIDSACNRILEQEPVVHGKWDVVHGMLSEHYNCSACKKGSVYKTNYCPNCGADMREDGE